MPWSVSAVARGAGTCARRRGPVWATQSTRAASAVSDSVTGPPSHPPPPGRTARPHAASISSAGHGRRAAAQPQEVLDVARRPRQRAGVTAAAPQPRSRRRVGDAGDRLGAQPGVAHDAALADPVLADLELRLDHQHQVAVSARDAEQRVEHQRQRDERQVAHHEVDRPADPSGVEVADVGAVVDDAPAASCRERPGQLPVADVHRDHLRGARRSSTSVKPPVDAPASRHRRPATTSPRGSKPSSAPASLCPPRET